ncbi:uncharacterized protein N7483_003262 [Penicillium malachiteum]|uniref:uncharacterized protein n=1 Tax=Penicillium malachiteum TaxID=1324776 RepID=UPI0025480352|nr:uncharacterized protein N7483_003262 [Penicillium malachiteum]KAJ5728754.1 hypothetical protein N7483_003262 [Penicillium malachiteum]
MQTRRKEKPKIISAKVRELQARLSRYESQVQNGGHVDAQRSTAMVASDPTQVRNVNASLLFNAPVDAERRHSAASPMTYTTSRTEAPPQRIETHFTLGSSQNFGSRIQDLLERQTDHSSITSCTPQGQAPRFSPSGEGLFPERRAPLKPRQGQESSLMNNLRLPSVKEGYQLLDTVILYLGDAQHYFDARDLSDQLMVFYRNNFDEIQRTSLWYLHILLVFAIGKLLRGDLDGTAGPPGYDLFKEALRLLPGISEIRAHGVAGIEILALVAVYYQNIDRKDDAASHIGLAFRLALLHKLYRKSTLNQLHPSQATHANRIWWTVQMHDKRLTIATGCPLSLDDKMIASGLPAPSPGYCDPLAIQLNIRIVQIQSRIYSVIYSNESCSENTFCDSVRDIMSSLTQIAKEIPQIPSRSTISSRDPSKLGIRTSISLFTMLYQAIILTLRPVLLHLAKLIFDRQTTFGTSSSALQHLARTCIEAASKNLDLMRVLVDEKIISIFGFFDLDAIFSASFILLLAKIISSADANDSCRFPFLNASPGIKEGFQLLDYLASYQNHAARARKRQIQTLQECMPSFMQGLGSAEMENQAVRTPQTISSNAGHEDITRSYTVGTAEGEFIPVTLPVEFSDDPHAIYSFFHDDVFELTGENQADLEEVQRHFLWQE